ncbi:putative methyltransferase-like protein [Rosellinia necatrix]|uniref:Putative methyltransferase-like protein n=1 Tax=Rosellinia necatrix TaxID=77044 RepID=A0A1W2TAX2_ROSNE|nr:putative methyltransferase-like protein [Rosellinia necatrix]
MATSVTTAPAQVLELNGAKKPEKRHVSTVINYYRDPGDGSPPMPVRISDNTVKNERPSIAKPTIIRDVTGDEDKYTLDKNGFQFCRRATRLRDADFHDSDLVEAEYYPEARQLLKDITGASRVHIFDHKTRVGPSDWHKLGEGNRASRGPLFRAHVDQSYAGAELVLRRHFPDEADDLVKRRYQIINIWRPLKTVQRDPLAVADAGSVPDSDLLPASILYARPGARDETWTVLPGGGGGGDEDEDEDDDGHRWYYKSAQAPDEALLIKCFDSAVAAGLARRAPHSAFADPGMEGCRRRESVEARALVFYD